MNELALINKDGQLVSDSREVSQMIRKRHDNLVRDIKGYAEILTTSKLRALDFFVESTYKDNKGESRPCYLLTKQGCEMVANKMTGEKGVLFTAKYVQAFNNMESFIQNNKMLNSFKAEVTTLVDELVSSKINEIESKCSKYYRPVSKEKLNIVNYIKKRLGIEKADEEYELVKQRVLIKLNAEKWEDVPVETLVNSLNIIDESIRVIKMDRPTQRSIWD